MQFGFDKTDRQAMSKTSYCVITSRLGTGKQMMHGMVYTECFGEQVVIIILQKLLKFVNCFNISIFECMLKKTIYLQNMTLRDLWDVSFIFGQIQKLRTKLTQNDDVKPANGFQVLTSAPLFAVRILIARADCSVVKTVYISIFKLTILCNRDAYHFRCLHTLLTFAAKIFFVQDLLSINEKNLMLQIFQSNIFC